MNKKIFSLIILLSLIGTLIWFWTKKLEPYGPTLKQDNKIKFLNKPQTLNFQLEDRESGLRSIKITLVQNDLQKDIYEEKLPGSLLWDKKNTIQKNIQINFDPVEMKLKEGTTTLIVTARDYSWRNKLAGNATILKQSFIIDRTPPSLSCLSTQHYLNQGGTGVVVYRTSDDSVKNGIYVDDIFFPGFPVKTANHPQAHVVYFAVPHDQKAPKFELVSEDEAGNESRTGFYYLLRKKSFRTDSLTITDNFLQSKIPQFFSADETLIGIPLAEAFLRINNYWRKQNSDKIHEICQHTDPQPLWKGKFLRLPNARSSALFGDRRTYWHKEKKIDHQVHMGIDLASLAHSPVPAANSGVVIFRGDLGIYGNTIIIDHGQNIFSMYSHLSTFSVSTGQKINIRQTIATTGSTGWAGGDHLHFAVMIGGVFVNPLEWWDDHWIKDNITLKLSLLSPQN